MIKSFRDYYLALYEENEPLEIYDKDILALTRNWIASMPEKDIKELIEDGRVGRLGPDPDLTLSIGLYEFVKEKSLKQRRLDKLKKINESYVTSKS